MFGSAPKFIVGYQIIFARFGNGQLLSPFPCSQTSLSPISIRCLSQGVDYTAMGQSSDFQAYVKHTAELQRVKLEGMTREEKLAFFINVYNALVIHANVARGPPVNLWQRYKVSTLKQNRSVVGRVDRSVGLVGR